MRCDEVVQELSTIVQEESVDTGKLVDTCHGYTSWIHMIHDDPCLFETWKARHHQDRSLSRGLVQRTFPVRALQSAVRMWDGNLSLCMLQMKDLH